MKTIIQIDSAEVILEYEFPYIQISISKGDQVQTCLTMSAEEAEMLRASVQAMVEVNQTQGISE